LVDQYPLQPKRPSRISVKSFPLGCSSLLSSARPCDWFLYTRRFIPGSITSAQVQVRSIYLTYCTVLNTEHRYSMKLDLRCPILLSTWYSNTAILAHCKQGIRLQYKLLLSVLSAGYRSSWPFDSSSLLVICPSSYPLCPSSNLAAQHASECPSW
jgi:hypothetical protein